jgi:GNAT superfamily N-acetyltransferase
MIVIRPEDPDSAAARELIEELSAALSRITGDSGKASFDADDVRGPRATFVVARDAQGGLLGCGALRPLAVPSAAVSVGELKRMFARPGTAGVGAALLAYLEQHAAALAYGALWLETRRVNPRAVRFYEQHGYTAIANYGKYAGRPEAICLGRQLDTTSAAKSAF